MVLKIIRLIAYMISWKEDYLSGMLFPNTLLLMMADTPFRHINFHKKGNNGLNCLSSTLRS